MSIFAPEFRYFGMDQREVEMSFTAGSGALTVTAPPNGNIAPPGYYMVFILNTSGVPSVATFVQVTPQPDFSIAASPRGRTVNRGSKTTYTATVKALGPFSGTVNFSVRGLPALTSASFNPTSVVGSGETKLRVATRSGAPTGTYPLKISGTSGGLKHSTSVKLVIQ